MKSIIYIGGVSAVGKTYLLSKLTGQTSKARFYTCDFSNLLTQTFHRIAGEPDFRGYEQESIYDAAVDKAVSILLENQPVVVAGHYFFQTPSGRKVYEGPFHRISPCRGFFHLICSPAELQSRLRRRGIDRAIKEIEDDQMFSYMAAEQLSRECHSQLHVLTNENEEELQNNIEYVFNVFKSHKAL